MSGHDWAGFASGALLAVSGLCYGAAVVVAAGALLGLRNKSNTMEGSNG